jgi:hypothetical protein
MGDPRWLLLAAILAAPLGLVSGTRAGQPRNLTNWHEVMAESRGYGLLARGSTADGTSVLLTSVMVPGRGHTAAYVRGDQGLVVRCHAHPGPEQRVSFRAQRDVLEIRMHRPADEDLDHLMVTFPDRRQLTLTRNRSGIVVHGEPDALDRSMRARGPLLDLVRHYVRDRAALEIHSRGTSWERRCTRECGLEISDPLGMVCAACPGACSAALQGAP